MYCELRVFLTRPWRTSLTSVTSALLDPTGPLSGSPACLAVETDSIVTGTLLP